MSGSTSGECHFWRLPLEVRFLIYDLVYDAGNTISLSLAGVHIELDRRGQPRVILRRRNRMQNIADKRLVNGQYLAETMQRLFENNTFRLTRVFDPFGVVRPGYFAHVRSLILDWDTYADPALMDINKMFPRLRRLELNIHSSQMPLFQTDERPQEATIRKTPLAIALSTVCDLRTVELHDMGYQGRSPAERDSRRLRVRALRNVLRQMVTRSVGEGEVLVRDW